MIEEDDDAAIGRGFESWKRIMADCQHGLDMQNGFRTRGACVKPQLCREARVCRFVADLMLHEERLQWRQRHERSS